MIVAIDGPAGSGKSTIARLLAVRLGFRYLDTGAMYRSVAVAALDAGTPLDDPDALGALARAVRISFEHEPGEPLPTRVLLDGRDVTAAIRTPAADRAVSPVSAAAPVRVAMVALQREIGSRADCVLEGRDIGTVVFPDAEVKVYLTATPEERASRRALDRAAAGHEADHAAVLADILRRDTHDSTREASPMRRADDAHVVDTTGLTIEQVVDRVAALVEAAR
ncbi:MAG: (d)CMP kinase [Coriobacteriaceae bacterium]|nr:(d)CMP kinase [Coriobacteriaceae bacterium]